jgi:3'(2'), 5'-bisphosphate nucleotidase
MTDAPIPPSELGDAALARRIADAAGALLLAVQTCGLFAGKALGDTGDAIANRFICDALRAARPDDGLLSEEEADNTARLARRRVWIVDPLDGTREFSEGRSDWAVHVGLAIDGVAAVGAVAQPGLDTTFCTAHPLGLVPPFDLPTRMLVSRTRPPREALAVAEALGAELVDIYLHSGGQYEWDNCAPAAVALAAGLHVSRLDGSPLVYNQPDPRLPDLLICHKEHAARVLEILAGLRAAAATG